MGERKPEYGEGSNGVVVDWTKRVGTTSYGLWSVVRVRNTEEPDGLYKRVVTHPQSHTTFNCHAERLHTDSELSSNFYLPTINLAQPNSHQKRQTLNNTTEQWLRHFFLRSNGNSELWLKVWLALLYNCETTCWREASARFTNYLLRNIEDLSSR